MKVSFVLHLKEAALSCDKLLVQDASDFLVETVIIKMVRSFFFFCTFPTIQNVNLSVTQFSICRD